ncbi:MAG: sodium:proton antiporter NhaD [Maribacter dokdonensis]|uniref:Na+/H+ antiporter NhaD n=1 Tax=Maribacter dokdonensis TaxID=320912 RepID=A0A1H4JMH1_9FLAO|nr:MULTISPECIES: sodium:proton antiporter NhaD [Maribacter]HAF78647.1 sodium:proton antiporter [Maribacter sp.]KSA12455.1 Na+/H+ antiporter NhaD type [Maribacter dokdonensis DSW-8]MBU2901368.1 sodium:proton antiporter NhaD [Maribacter dokdonensis]MDP2527501.1 sodium:proton antiporter NhaD [Maribacter dokdonensis]PHN91924.1 sodium:proton antiporter [Maribacter sp. 6B07]|tara:strand:- start:102696 stop:104066 length:1371 start_codon:yes stop_codon:yes gene_type:complete
METIIIIVFLAGYLAITLEHNLKIDKLIPALAMMAILWALIALGIDGYENWFDSVQQGLVSGFSDLGHLDKMHIMEESLLHHLGKTAEILFFLLGAMTIVEIIDYFDGFATIKGFIKTKKKSKLLWLFSILAFILSAIIDNLTATIVLITILQKVIKDRETKLWFAGMIVITANAGGAWSPIGDVTTTMLWIANKVSAGQLVIHVLLPSLVCMLVPVLIAGRFKIFKGLIDGDLDGEISKSKYGGTMLYLGLGAILFVPIFKTVTHLPPYVGMMLSLAVVATFAEIYSNKKFNISSVEGEDDDNAGHHSPVHHSLSKIELPSILFFLGILLAVAAMESLGILFNAAGALNEAIPNTDIVVMLFGVGSAVIDNVPLVAASMGMFSEPLDSPLWHFIAYSAGTGGSMLIIGSAAGVVAMGMEKIDFFWYLKKIAWLALIGFVSGAIVFILLRDFVLHG